MGTSLLPKLGLLLFLATSITADEGPPKCVPVTPDQIKAVFTEYETWATSINKFVSTNGTSTLPPLQASLRETAKSLDLLKCFVNKTGMLDVLANRQLAEFLQNLSTKVDDTNRAVCGSRKPICPSAVDPSRHSTLATWQKATRGEAGDEAPLIHTILTSTFRAFKELAAAVLGDKFYRVVNKRRTEFQTSCAGHVTGGWNQLEAMFKTTETENPYLDCAAPVDEKCEPLPMVAACVDFHLGVARLLVPVCNGLDNDKASTVTKAGSTALTAVAKHLSETCLQPPVTKVTTLGTTIFTGSTMSEGPSTTGTPTGTPTGPTSSIGSTVSEGTTGPDTSTSTEVSTFSTLITDSTITDQTSTTGTLTHTSPSSTTGITVSEGRSGPETTSKETSSLTSLTTGLTVTDRTPTTGTLTVTTTTPTTSTDIIVSEGTSGPDSSTSVEPSTLTTLTTASTGVSVSEGTSGTDASTSSAVSRMPTPISVSETATASVSSTSMPVSVVTAGPTTQTTAIPTLISPETSDVTSSEIGTHAESSTSSSATSETVTIAPSSESPGTMAKTSASGSTSEQPKSTNEDSTTGTTSPISGSTTVPPESTKEDSTTGTISSTSGSTSEQPERPTEELTSGSTSVTVLQTSTSSAETKSDLSTSSEATSKPPSTTETTKSSVQQPSDTPSGTSPQATPDTASPASPITTTTTGVTTTPKGPTKTPETEPTEPTEPTQPPTAFYMPSTIKVIPFAVSPLADINRTLAGLVTNEFFCKDGQYCVIEFARRVFHGNKTRELDTALYRTFETAWRLEADNDPPLDRPLFDNAFSHFRRSTATDLFPADKLTNDAFTRLESAFFKPLQEKQDGIRDVRKNYIQQAFAEAKSTGNVTDELKLKYKDASDACKKFNVDDFTTGELTALAKEVENSRLLKQLSVDELPDLYKYWIRQTWFFEEHLATIIWCLRVTGRDQNNRTELSPGIWSKAKLARTKWAEIERQFLDVEEHVTQKGILAHADQSLANLTKVVDAVWQWHGKVPCRPFERCLMDVQGAFGTITTESPHTALAEAFYASKKLLLLPSTDESAKLITDLKNATSVLMARYNFAWTPDDATPELFTEHHRHVSDNMPKAQVEIEKAFSPQRENISVGCENLLKYTNQMQFPENESDRNSITAGTHKWLQRDRTSLFMFWATITAQFHLITAQTRLCAKTLMPYSDDPRRINEKRDALTRAYENLEKLARAIETEFIRQEFRKESISGEAKNRSENSLNEIKQVVTERVVAATADRFVCPINWNDCLRTYGMILSHSEQHPKLFLALDAAVRSSDLVEYHEMQTAIVALFQQLQHAAFTIALAGVRAAPFALREWINLAIQHGLTLTTLASHVNEKDQWRYDSDLERLRSNCNASAALSNGPIQAFEAQINNQANRTVFAKELDPRLKTNRTLLVPYWLYVSAQLHVEQFVTDWCAKLLSPSLDLDFQRNASATAQGRVREIEQKFYEVERKILANWADNLTKSAEAQFIAAEKQTVYDVSENFPCKFLKQCLPFKTLATFGNLSNGVIEQAWFAIGLQLAHARDTSKVNGLRQKLNIFRSDTTKLFDDPTKAVEQIPRELLLDAKLVGKTHAIELLAYDFMRVSGDVNREGLGNESTSTATSTSVIMSTPTTISTSPGSVSATASIATNLPPVATTSLSTGMTPTATVTTVLPKTESQTSTGPHTTSEISSTSDIPTTVSQAITKQQTISSTTPAATATSMVPLTQPVLVTAKSTPNPATSVTAITTGKDTAMRFKRDADVTEKPQLSIIHGQLADACNTTNFDVWAELIRLRENLTSYNASSMFSILSETLKLSRSALYKLWLKQAADLSQLLSAAAWCDVFNLIVDTDERKRERLAEAKSIQDFYTDVERLYVENYWPIPFSQGRCVENNHYLANLEFWNVAEKCTTGQLCVTSLVAELFGPFSNSKIVAAEELDKRFMLQDAESYPLSTFNKCSMKFILPGLTLNTLAVLRENIDTQLARLVREARNDSLAEWITVMDTRYVVENAIILQYANATYYQWAIKSEQTAANFSTAEQALENVCNETLDVNKTLHSFSLALQNASEINLNETVFTLTKGDKGKLLALWLQAAHRIHSLLFVHEFCYMLRFDGNLEHVSAALQPDRIAALEIQNLFDLAERFIMARNASADWNRTRARLQRAQDQLNEWNTAKGDGRGPLYCPMTQLCILDKAENITGSPVDPTDGSEGPILLEVMRATAILYGNPETATLALDAHAKLITFSETVTKIFSSAKGALALKTQNSDQLAELEAKSAIPEELRELVYISANVTTTEDEKTAAIKQINETCQQNFTSLGQDFQTALTNASKNWGKDRKTLSAVWIYAVWRVGALDFAAEWCKQEATGIYGVNQLFAGIEFQTARHDRLVTYDYETVLKNTVNDMTKRIPATGEFPCQFGKLCVKQYGLDIFGSADNSSIRRILDIFWRRDGLKGKITETDQTTLDRNDAIYQLFRLFERGQHFDALEKQLTHLAPLHSLISWATNATNSGYFNVHMESHTIDPLPQFTGFCDALVLYAVPGSPDRADNLRRADEWLERICPAFLGSSSDKGNSTQTADVPAPQDPFSELQEIIGTAKNDSSLLGEFGRNVSYNRENLTSLWVFVSLRLHAMLFTQEFCANWFSDYDEAYVRDISKGHMTTFEAIEEEFHRAEMVFDEKRTESIHADATVRLRHYDAFMTDWTNSELFCSILDSCVPTLSGKLNESTFRLPVDLLRLQLARSASIRSDAATKFTSIEASLKQGSIDEQTEQTLWQHDPSTAADTLFTSLKDKADRGATIAEEEQNLTAECGNKIPLGSSLGTFVDRTITNASFVAHLKQTLTDIPKQQFTKLWLHTVAHLSKLAFVAEWCAEFRYWNDTTKRNGYKRGFDESLERIENAFNRMALKNFGMRFVVDKPDEAINPEEIRINVENIMEAPKFTCSRASTQKTCLRGLTEEMFGKGFSNDSKLQRSRRAFIWYLEDNATQVRKFEDALSGEIVVYEENKPIRDKLRDIHPSLGSKNTEKHNFDLFRDTLPDLIRLLNREKNGDIVVTLVKQKAEEAMTGCEQAMNNDTYSVIKQAGDTHKSIRQNDNITNLLAFGNTAEGIDIDPKKMPAMFFYWFYTVVGMHEEIVVKEICSRILASNWSTLTTHARDHPKVKEAIDKATEISEWFYALEAEALKRITTLPPPTTRLTTTPKVTVTAKAVVKRQALLESDSSETPTAEWRTLGRRTAYRSGPADAGIVGGGVYSAVKGAYPGENHNTRMQGADGTHEGRNSNAETIVDNGVSKIADQNQSDEAAIVGGAALAKIDETKQARKKVTGFDGAKSKPQGQSAEQFSGIYKDGGTKSTSLSGELQKKGFGGPLADKPIEGKGDGVVPEAARAGVNQGSSGGLENGGTKSLGEAVQKNRIGRPLERDASGSNGDVIGADAFGDPAATNGAVGKSG